MAGPKQKAAAQNFGLAENTAGQSLNRQNSIYQPLESMIMGEASNPGNTPAAVAAGQSLGGTVSGAVGQGNLQAARTRNSAGYAPALDQSARNAGKQQSQNVLNVQQEGQAGLQGLEGMDTSELENMIGGANQATNNMNGPAWQQILSAVSGLGSQAAGAYGDIYGKGG